MTESATPAVERPNISPLDIIRAAVLIVALVSFALWGFLGFALPWNIILGVGLPVVVLLVWALFLSPRPTLRVHPFLRALVELFIYVGVTLAWWAMGQVWIGLGYAIVAVAAGVMAGRRSLT